VKDGYKWRSHEVMNRGGARENKRYTVRQVRYVKYKTGGTTEIVVFLERVDDASSIAREHWQPGDRWKRNERRRNKQIDGQESANANVVKRGL